MSFADDLNPGVDDAIIKIYFIGICRFASSSQNLSVLAYKPNGKTTVPFFSPSDLLQPPLALQVHAIPRLSFFSSLLAR